MSSKVAYDSITGFMTANWSATPIVDIENTAPALPDEPFIAMMFPFAIEEQASVGAPGNNVFREFGNFQVLVFVESGVGMDTLLTLGEQVRNLLRGQRIDDVQIDAVNPMSYAEDQSSIEVGGGNWYRRIINVDYYNDIHA